MKKINVGVLALQGDFKEHIKMLKCFCYDAGGSGQCCDGFFIGIGRQGCSPLLKSSVIKL